MIKCSLINKKRFYMVSFGNSGGSINFIIHKGTQLPFGITLGADIRYSIPFRINSIKDVLFLGMLASGAGLAAKLITDEKPTLVTQATRAKIKKVFDVCKFAFPATLGLYFIASCKN
jgi:hypothetical protein